MKVESDNAMERRKWLVFGIGVSFFLISLFYRASTAVISVDLARDLKLDHHQLGLLGAAFFYAFALVQFPLGPFLDRLGARRTMLYLNIAAVAGGFLFAGAGGFAQGMAGRALIGLGMSANLIGPLMLCTAWFPPNWFATMTGLVMAVGTLGSLSATTPLAFLAHSIGWRAAFYGLAALHAGLILCLLVLVRDRPVDIGRPSQKGDANLPPPPFFRSMKTLFASWNYWAISWSVFFRYGSYAAIQALWAGPFLMEFLGLSAITAGNLLLMINIGFAVGAPAGGVVSDRILNSRKNAMMLGLAIAATATFAFSRWHEPTLLPLLAATMFVIGFSNGFGQVSYAHIKELMPREMSGTAMAGINFFLMFGPGIFIHALGDVLHRKAAVLSPGVGGYQTAFLICLAAVLASLALYATTRDTAASPKRANS